MANISAVIDDEVEAQIKKIAENEDRSTSNVVNRLLKKALGDTNERKS